MSHDSLAIRYEANTQPIKAGKSRFRLRHELYLLSSFEFGEQRSVRDCDFDHCGMRSVSPEVQLLVRTGIFREYLGTDLYFGFFFIGRLPDPVFKAVVAFVAHGLE